MDIVGILVFIALISIIAISLMLPKQYKFCCTSCGKQYEISIKKMREMKEKCLSCGNKKFYFAIIVKTFEDSNFKISKYEFIDGTIADIFQNKNKLYNDFLWDNELQERIATAMNIDESLAKTIINIGNLTYEPNREYQVAINLMYTKKVEDAIDLFNYIVKIYPNSKIAHDARIDLDDLSQKGWNVQQEKSRVTAYRCT